MTSHVFSTLCSGWNSVARRESDRHLPVAGRHDGAGPGRDGDAGAQCAAGEEEHHGDDHAVKILRPCLPERMPFADFRFCLPVAHQQEQLIAAVHDAVDRFVQHGGRPGDGKPHELRYGYQYVGTQSGNDTHHAALVFLLLFLHILSVYFPAALLTSFSISIFSS